MDLSSFHPPICPFILPSILLLASLYISSQPTMHAYIYHLSTISFLCINYLSSTNPPIDSLSTGPSSHWLTCHLTLIISLPVQAFAICACQWSHTWFSMNSSFALILRILYLGPPLCPGFQISWLSQGSGFKVLVPQVCLSWSQALCGCALPSEYCPMLIVALHF